MCVLSDAIEVVKLFPDFIELLGETLVFVRVFSAVQTHITGQLIHLPLDIPTPGSIWKWKV
jgi:hypothetical protein